MISQSILRMPLWALPVFAGFAWLVTLLSLLIAWTLKGSPHYSVMSANQHFPYISDIGASDWGKPLFVTGATIVDISFALAFSIERWFEHRGRLLHRGDLASRITSYAATCCNVIGAVGLILLTIYDWRVYPVTHMCMVGLFILGYYIAAILSCSEKKWLSAHYPDDQILRYSFQLKLVFITVQSCLVLVFVGTGYFPSHDISAVTEWIVAAVFYFYLSSFAIDCVAVQNAARVESGEESLFPWIETGKEAGRPLLTPALAHVLLSEDEEKEDRAFVEQMA